MTRTLPALSGTTPKLAAGALQDMFDRRDVVGRVTVDRFGRGDEVGNRRLVAVDDRLRTASCAADAWIDDQRWAETQADLDREAAAGDSGTLETVGRPAVSAEDNRGCRSVRRPPEMQCECWAARYRAVVTLSPCHPRHVSFNARPDRET